jgi:tRNA threonylcarbamoyl adenosine modification protein (Sua5/YciO/YrdC/YwlC family)
MIIELGDQHPSPYHVERLVTYLEDDGIIAMPTDTSYSLACLPDRKNAVQKLMSLRRLDPKKALALVFSDIKQVSAFTMLDDRAFRLIRRYLPGPYCFILEARRELPRYIGDKRKRIGVRIPDHGVPQAIIRAVDRPLIVTSAVDPESGIMASDPWTVEATFGHGISAVIDAGDVPGGESTVIDLTTEHPEVIRPGIGDYSEFGA